jgi:hypothetical protein
MRLPGRHRRDGDEYSDVYADAMRPGTDLLAPADDQRPAATPLPDILPPPGPHEDWREEHRAAIADMRAAFADATGHLHHICTGRFLAALARAQKSFDAVADQRDRLATMASADMRAQNAAYLATMAEDDQP